MTSGSGTRRSWGGTPDEWEQTVTETAPVFRNLVCILLYQLDWEWGEAGRDSWHPVGLHAWLQMRRLACALGNGDQVGCTLSAPAVVHFSAVEIHYHEVIKPCCLNGVTYSVIVKASLYDTGMFSPNCPPALFNFPSTCLWAVVTLMRS